MHDPTHQTVVLVGKALSDPSRVRILCALFLRECCACELVTMLDLAQASVSRHLSVLVQSGLILSRKEGRWMHYRIPKKKESSNLFVYQTLKSLRTTLRKSKQRKCDLSKLEGCEGTIHK